ncbi:MAG: response regulator transcription factor [Planctomycetota bacterium]|jgi:FixJ family two-component response regulator
MANTMTPLKKTPAQTQATIFVIDDEEAMRESMEILLEDSGLPVETFASADDFLEQRAGSAYGCAIVDVRMPGMDGVELQEALRERGVKLPTIMVTAHGDVSLAVRAMQAGAFDFLEKPCEREVLLDRVTKAVAEDDRRRERDVLVSEYSRRYERLSARESEVMKLVVQGLLNKQAAAELGISIKTIEVHRARVMEKMEAESLAELVKMAIAIGLD